MCAWCLLRVFYALDDPSLEQRRILLREQHCWLGAAVETRSGSLNIKSCVKFELRVLVIRLLFRSWCVKWVAWSAGVRVLGKQVAKNNFMGVAFEWWRIKAQVSEPLGAGAGH